MRASILLLLCFTWLNSSAQIDRSEVLGAYIFNFAKLSTSPQQNQYNSYNLFVVTNNTDIIEEFKQMKAHVRIHDKPINLTISDTGKDDFSKACLVFIASDMMEQYQSIFKKTTNTEALLISENFDDKKSILLNLYEAADNTMKFEMNKGNIHKRNITINDEILLMGGTIVDLSELYVEAQQELKSSDIKMDEFEDSVKVLSKVIGQSQNEISHQQYELEEQKEIIAKQSTEKKQLTSDINKQKQQLTSILDAYKQNEDKMLLYNDSLLRALTLLQSYQQKINTNNKILQQQQQEIESNRAILNQKDKTIKTQRLIVFAFIIGITTNLILVFLLLKSLKDKKKRNKQLKNQKQELAKQNEVLMKNSNLIESMMDEISESNEELTATLEENKRMQHKLVQSEKMASLGVLSAGIAHEINNPINFVYAGINSLLRDFEDIKPVIDEVSLLNIDSENLKEKIELIKQLKEENYFDEAMEAIPEIINDIKLGADRTAEIVKGLRNFTHMDTDHQETLNINEGLDTSLLLLKNKYKNHIEIVKNYSPSLPDLLCFPGKINQAFLNILANAVDAIEEKGKITITTNKEDDYIEISIKDNGPGIPEEIQSKIFDPFFTTKSVGEGTGLGLAITYGIITEHNGTINVISNSNDGSEFIIKLPINHLP
nr:YfiR/HmsC family protein [uncultured Carboxylicivirga sp.]